MKRRRAAVILAAALVASGCRSRERTPAEGEHPAWEGTIVAMGDSLTAGPGIAQEEAWPARLEVKLQAAGYRFRVVNAGVSGETSSGALSRVDWLMNLTPDIVILETGGNDGLRGIDPSLTAANVDAIVRRLLDRRLTVVLAGMKMVTNLGREYTDAFAAVFPRVASAHGLIFIPFLLEGVAADRSLNLADGIHPNAEGHRRVAETIYPFAVRAIEAWRRTRPPPG